MIKDISTKGGIEPVGFDKAVLAGFADDGGLFVPDSIPLISHDKLGELIQTVSSAIDIVLPYNFWRFLYFVSGCSTEKTKNWMDKFDKYGRICIDEKTLATISSKNFRGVRTWLSG